MIYDIPNIKSFVSRPTVMFKNIRLSISDSPIIHELDTENFYKGLQELYPESTFIDLLDWVHFLDSLGIPLDKNSLASAYSFFWNETTEALSQQSLMWPDIFKAWCKNKKAHVNDLRPLCLVQGFNPNEQKMIYEFLMNYEALKLSLSDGKKILELFVDIIGSNPSEYINLGHELLELKLSSEQIIKKLSRIRYPISSKKDEKKQAFSKNTNWPPNIKVNFLRQGDQAGFELSLFIHQSDHKEKYLKSFKESLDKIDHYLMNQNPELNA